MPRVMHVVDLGGRSGNGSLWGYDDLLAARRWVMRDGRDLDNSLVLIGGAHSLAACRDGTDGFSGVRRATGRLGRGWLAGREVRRAWIELDRPEIVVCWNPFAFESVSGIPDAGARLTLAFHDPASAALSPCLSGMARSLLYSPVNGVVCAGDPPAWLDALSIASPVRLCEPDMPECRLQEQSRNHDDSAEKAIRLALLGRAPDADAMRFAFLMGLLLCAGCDAIGIISESATSIPRARRYAHELGGIRVQVSKRPNRDLLRQCDLAIWIGAGDGPTRTAPALPRAAAVGVRDCIEIGVPFVAPHWAVPEGWLSPSAASLALASSASLTELSRVVAPLALNAERRQSLRLAMREGPHGADSDPRHFGSVLRHAIGLEAAITAG